MSVSWNRCRRPVRVVTRLNLQRSRTRACAQTAGCIHPGRAAVAQAAAPVAQLRLPAGAHRLRVARAQVGGVHSGGAAAAQAPVPGARLHRPAEADHPHAGHALRGGPRVHQLLPRARVHQGAADQPGAAPVTSNPNTKSIQMQVAATNKRVWDSTTLSFGHTLQPLDHKVVDLAAIWRHKVW